MDKDQKIEFLKARVAELENSMEKCKLTTTELQMMQYTMEHINESFFWIDPDAHFVKVNNMACEQLGYSIEELQSLTIHDIDPNFLKESWSNHWNDLKEKGSLNFESLHKRKDGSVYPVEVKLSYIKFEDQEYNFAIVKDITERKQAEEALQEEGEKFRSTIESITDGFFTLDENLVITYFNKAAENLLGRAEKDVIHKHLFNEAFPEAKGSIFEENYTKALKTRKFVWFETYFGVEPFINWYDVRVYPSKEGISIFFQVTTERKQAEQELKKLNEELETRVAEKTKELQERIIELERWYDATVDRELRMKELRVRIEELEKQINQ